MKVKFLAKVSKAIKGVRGKNRKGAIMKHILHKFKIGALHRRGAGGKTGPVVKDRRMAIAIALNSARRLNAFAEGMRRHLDILRQKANNNDAGRTL